MFKWLTGRGEKGRVVNIVYGDTVDVQFDGGERDRVRLIGVDCPERNYRNPEPWSMKATEFTREYLANETVTLRQDRNIEDRDTYGRLLRYIEVGGNDISLLLLLNGMGKHMDGDYKRNWKYKGAQHDAMSEREGMWKTRKRRVRDYIPGPW